MADQFEKHTKETKEEKEQKNDKNKEVNDNEQLEKENDLEVELEEALEEDVDVLKDMIQKKDAQVSEYVDQLKRQMAEFDNYRKRTEKEKTQMYVVGAKEVLEKILPVVDNFERALISLSEAERKAGFAQGVEMIYKQLMTALKDLGVEPIEAVGQPFDPNYHEAVMHAEDKDFGENTVAQEFQKGYLYKENVLRHSMVKVVN